MLAQRAFELIIAKYHEKKLKHMGAGEIDKNGYRFIVGMHSTFFVSLVLERLILNRTLSRWWIIFAIIFVVAQVLRYWAIASLGIYWNTKILIAPHHPLLRKRGIQNFSTSQLHCGYSRIRCRASNFFLLHNIPGFYNSKRICHSTENQSRGASAGGKLSINKKPDGTFT